MNFNALEKEISESAECASVCSYREAADKVRSMTGQTISHGGAWNVIQNLGERRPPEKGAEMRDALRNKVMVCGFGDSKSFQSKKEGAIAAVFKIPMKSR